MSKISKVLDLLNNSALTKELLNQKYHGYLVDSGWIQSYLNQMPVNKDGSPLPWVTIPFIDFIVNRLTSEMTVFEFGSGNSTLFYSKKVKEVYSLEHDKDWADRIKKNIPSNVTLIFCKLIYDGEYCRSANHLDKKFDLIVVDGRDRVNCIKNSIGSLTQAGIIVLDDSERVQYQEGVDFLTQQGFRKIDFWGIAPGLSYKKCTTIFYKDNNCLLI